MRYPPGSASRHTSPTGAITVRKIILGLVAATLVASPLAMSAPANAATRSFANCTAMHKVYKHGGSRKAGPRGLRQTRRQAARLPGQCQERPRQGRHRLRGLSTESQREGQGA